MRNFISRFKNNTSGSIPILVGGIMVILVVAGGGAVDMWNAHNERERLQNSLDSAALYAAQTSTTDKAKIGVAINDYFKGVAGLHKNVNNMKIEYDIESNSDGNVVKVWASGRVENVFLRFANNLETDVKVYSEVTSPKKDIEIVLVLDNTGSMAGQKIQILREAANNFVDEMKSITSSNVTVKIGVVPFHTQVRVPEKYKNEGWISFEDVNTETNWSGCIWDRESFPSKKRDANIKFSNFSDAYPATLLEYSVGWGNNVNTQNKCNIAYILDLTDNYNDVKATISSMTAGGYTNVGLGLIWGWNLLDPAKPFTNAANFNDKFADKFIILLTDGEITFNRRAYNPNSGKIIPGQLKKGTEEACVNMKNVKVSIFTIRVVNGDKDMLENCASDTSMFYDINNPTQMKQVFESISTRIKKLYISY